MCRRAVQDVQVQVHVQTSAHSLLKEWMMERSKEGYSITATQEVNGNYTLAVMSKEGMPYIQQAYLVRTQATSFHSFKTDALLGLDFSSVLHFLSCSLDHLCPTSVP